MKVPQFGGPQRSIHISHLTKKELLVHLIKCEACGWEGEDYEENVP